MMSAAEAREISSKVRAQNDWYWGASEALRDAMEEIEIAARHGDSSVRVIGMTDEAAKMLSSYGYSLRQEPIPARWARRADGSYVWVKECTNICW